jgi:type IV pilus assembly protein PilB
MNEGKLARGGKAGEVLMARGLITAEQLQRALEVQRRAVPRPLLGEVVVELGLCTEDQVVEALAEAHGIPYAKLEPALVDGAIVKMIPRDYSLKHNVLALFCVDRVLTVAVSEPTNLYLVEEIGRLVDGGVHIVAASARDIQAMLDVHVQHEDTLGDLVDDAPVDVVERRTPELLNLEEIASESPVIKIVNHLIHSAVRERASDIHIEPDDGALRVRFRIDGRLQERVHPPEAMHPAIVSRIKIMAGLDISERRLPQDGGIHVRLHGKPVDLRVSILPTAFGEKVVLRIIDTSQMLVGLDRLGLAEAHMAVFKREIGRPHGLILVTGPTGSGKSTTLYAVLSELNHPRTNICSVEDPIELNLSGINQFQVHERIGLTFSAVLRSMLRQDPDVIMVGEMRDSETAMIGVQASLTGHLVLSTLHTNDAPGAITRLYNLGVEAYLVGASLSAVLAQRLVRRLCPHCKVLAQPSPATAAQLARLEAPPLEACWKGRGCTRCHNTGYQGRIGIFELLVPDDDMRDLITAGATLEQLRAKARGLGMQRMFRDGLAKVRDGVTTVEEVLLVTLAE